MGAIRSKGWGSHLWASQFQACQELRHAFHICSEILAELAQTARFVESVAKSGDKAIHSLLCIKCRNEPDEPFRPIVIRTDNLPSDPEQRHKLFFSVGVHAAQVAEAIPVMAVYHHE